MDRLNYINSGNAAYIDSLYEAYKQDPDPLTLDGKNFLKGLTLVKKRLRRQLR